MKVLLKGYYGFGNFGDDLLLISIHQLITEIFPDADITIFSNASKNNPDFPFKDRKNYNQYIMKLMNDDSLRIIDWTHREIFDTQINGGGGVFFDYCQAGKLRHFFNKIVSLFSPETINHIEMVLRKLLGKSNRIRFGRNLAIGVNIGPFSVESRSFASIYSNIGSIQGFLVRDKQSLEYLDSVNYHGYKNLISDIVFCNRKLFSDKALANPIKNNKRIGIVIMDWPHCESDVILQLENIIQKKELDGYHFHFFAFCEIDDFNLVKRVKRKISFWLPHKISINNYIEEFSQMDIIVSMRFHGLVLATKLNIPSIGIAINPKIKDYCTQANKCSQFVEIDQLEKTLPAILDQYDKNYESMVKEANRTNQEFSKSEAAIRDFLADMVK